MSYKTRDGKTHQSTVIMGDNGLPIDGIATIAGSYVFLESQTDPLVYTAIAATVTLPVGNDLSPVVSAKPRYTGRYVLITKDNSIFYINRQSIDVVNRTFVISRSDSSQITPVAIDLSPGWTVAEADIVNRMATTSSAKIDSVEFRDMHFQMQIDGDPVSILNVDGEKINPATEEKQGEIINQLELVNDELDTHTIQLQQVNDDLNSQFDETQVKQDTQISQLTEANSSLNDIELRSLIPLLANANWMKLGNFDNITPSIVGDTLSLSYLEAGANIGKADIRYTSNIDWEIKLERYINDTNGDILLDDDNTPLTLD